MIMGLTAAETHAASVDALFTQFTSKFGKEYGSVDERAQRMTVFAANVDRVKELNHRDAHANYSYLTRWADVTAAEFQSIHGLAPQTQCQLIEPAPTLHPTAEPKDSIDYVALGATVEVKDQGDCGSCWAHATTAAVEGRLKLDEGKTTSLSVEFLMDCDTARVCQGCCGGLSERAMQWLSGSPGIASTEDYPYTSADGSDGRRCNSSAPLAAKVTGYGIVPGDSLPSAITEYGVLATAMDSSPLQFYTGGVITDVQGCQSTANHAVAIVGYGTDSGVDYWKVRTTRTGRQHLGSGPLITL